MVSRYVRMRASTGAEFMLIAAEPGNSLRSHDKIRSRNVYLDGWNMSQQRGNAANQSVPSKRGTSLDKCRLSLVLEINTVQRGKKKSNRSIKPALGNHS